jgi:hypothetical protein
MLNHAMMFLGYVCATLAMLVMAVAAAYRVSSWLFARRQKRSFQAECRVLDGLGDPQKAGALIAALSHGGGQSEMA